MFGNIIYTPSPNTYCKYALLGYCVTLKVETKIQYTSSGIGFIVVDGNSSASRISTSTAIFCYRQNSSIWNTLHAAVKYSNTHDRRVVLFDYPGYGLSEGSPWEGSIVAALTDVIRTLGLPSVHLVGDSLGAGVVLSYLAKTAGSSPTTVDTVRLISPFISMTDKMCGNSSNLLSAVYRFCGDCFYQNDRNIWAVPKDVPVFIFSLAPFEDSDIIILDKKGKEKTTDGERLCRIRGNTHYVQCDYPWCGPDEFGYVCASKEDVVHPYSQYTEKMSEF